MPNVTDVVASLQTTLQSLLKPGEGTAMLMSWPGYALSPQDFKSDPTPTAPYDPQVAEETGSHLADMIPAGSSGPKFEDSLFEVHNIYEALLFTGIFKPQPDGSINPAVRLFSDAQFVFRNAEKGSKIDPQVLYYPAKATPVDWYAETSASWQTFKLEEGQIHPAPAGSPWLKPGMMQNLIRVSDPAVNTTLQLQTKLRSNLAVSLTAANRNAVTLPAAAIKATAAHPIGATATTATAATAALARKSFSTVPQLAKTTVPAAAMIDARNATIKPSFKMPIAQRVALDQLLVKGLPAATAPATSTGWRIQFRYCVVQLRRDWLNSTILSLPNWFVPGLHGGFFTAGDGAQFPLLSQSFIAIRDLRITAAWTEQDRKTLANAVSFGPFRLPNKIINQNELRADGLQVVAWLCRHTPTLPPASDPTL